MSVFNSEEENKKKKKGKKENQLQCQQQTAAAAEFVQGATAVNTPEELASFAAQQGVSVEEIQANPEFQRIQEEKATALEEQNKKIQSLSSEVIRLNDAVVSGNQECTNKIINREREIAIYIEDLIRMGKGSMGKNQLVRRTETYNGMDTIVMSSPMIIEDNDMERMITGLQTLKSNLVKK